MGDVASGGRCSCSMLGRQRGRRARSREHVRVVMLARMGVQRRHGVASQKEIAGGVGADVRRTVRVVRHRIRRLAKVLALVAGRHGRVRVRAGLGQLQAHMTAVHERVQHGRRIGGTGRGHGGRSRAGQSAGRRGSVCGRH